MKYNAPRITATQSLEGALSEVRSKAVVSDAEVKHNVVPLDEPASDSRD